MSRDIAEVFRYLFDAQASEASAGGSEVLGTTTTDPLRAVILGGIRPRPEIGTTNLFVEPGVAMLVNPDSPASTDDSVLKWVVDPGVQTAGQLVLTAGAVSTRIDVIECQRVDSVLEADNRDIFNASTGLFTAALVNKVLAGRLTYRIRVGVAGAGFPGTAAGWLPLAVAKVPSTATTWNDCDLWDVRPLASDFVRAPFNITQTFPHAPRQYAMVRGTTLLNRRLMGVIEAEYLGRRLGGDLAPSVGSSGYIDVLDATNVIEPGFAAVSNTPWYVYLLTPFGLPRWAPYTPSTSGIRVPRSPRGIPVYTQKAPLDVTGKPSVAVTLPTGTGLGGSTQDGVAIIAGAYDNSGNWLDSIVEHGVTRVNQPGMLLAPSAGAGTAGVTYDLIDNTTHPANAVAVRVRFATTISVAAGTDLTVDRILATLNSSGGTLINERFSSTERSPVSGTFADRFEATIPLYPNTPSGTPITRQVTLTYSVGGGAVTYSAQNAFVIGWHLQP